MTTRQPSQAQWRAVREGLERFTGRGRWSAFSPIACQLPPVEIRWIDPANPEPGFPIERAAAMTSLFADGRIVVCFRLDQQPRNILRSALHELQHVVDADAIRSRRMSEATYEQRARDTAERLSALGPW
jgi:hypothetical protein